MTSAHDVSAAIIARLGSVDPMRLNKLLYLAQAMSLSWRGEPMFREPVEGWRLGPMVKSVYHTYKDLGDQEITESRGGDLERLDRDDRHVLTAVLDLYGALSGPELARITHADEAWQAAWSGRASEDRGNQPLDADLIVHAVNTNAAMPPVGKSELQGLAKAARDGDKDALSRLFENV